MINCVLCFWLYMLLCSTVPTLAAATHGSELLYAFNVNMFVTPYVRTRNDRKITKIMTTLLANFIKFGYLSKSLSHFLSFLKAALLSQSLQEVYKLSFCFNLFPFFPTPRKKWKFVVDSSFFFIFYKLGNLLK